VETKTGGAEVKIDKAIKILDRHYNLHHNVSRAELDEASRLGIEALKRQKLMREHSGMSFDYYLLGETED